MKPVTRRLQDMLNEFASEDLEALSDFIYDTSRAATHVAIANVPDGRYGNEMQVDGYDAPVQMVVELVIEDDQLSADFTGTSGMSRFGVNVPEVLHPRLWLFWLEMRDCSPRAQ